MRIVLVADTHIPARGRDLPGALWTAIEAADAVLHAGDWTAAALVDEFAARSRRLVACWGNNDGPDVRERLPERAEATLAGVRFTVVHETGAAAGRDARMARRYPDTDVLVFGHSHIPWDSTAAGGLRLLNPGSPVDRRRQPHCSYMTAEVANGTVGEVTVHRV